MVEVHKVSASKEREELTFKAGYRTVVPTIAQLLRDLSSINDIGLEVSKKLERVHEEMPLSVGNAGWEVVPKIDDPLRKNYIMIAKATQHPLSHPDTPSVPTLDAVFLKWCPGTSGGEGKWVYLTVDLWNPRGREINPSPRTALHYRNLFLDLGLPVHVASFRGLERETKWRLDEFLNLNAVVYGPDGKITGRIANEYDFDEEGVLVRVGDVMRLYKGQ